MVTKIGRPGQALLDGRNRRLKATAQIMEIAKRQRPEFGPVIDGNSNRDDRGGIAFACAEGHRLRPLRSSFTRIEVARYHVAVVRTLPFLFTIFSLSCAPKAKPAAVPVAVAAVTSTNEIDPELADRMKLLGQRLEEKREELGIPGMAVVVVRDGQAILSQGFGIRNVDDGTQVDRDTLFAIGSTTKAFTSMLIMRAVDDGKISLDDHPRKCVPYFKLKDPEADKNITVRDLLIHSSGLMRTDMSWYTGALNTREIIEIAGRAEPTAKLREGFQYQNVMYAVAGECLANIRGKPYAEVLREEIFAPLGMTHGTNVSVKDNLAQPNRALGYVEAGPEETLTVVPMRPIDQVAAAGAINASIRDIEPWLVLMLNEGALDGRRLVSPEGFAELVDKQHKIGPTLHYGLGWMRDHWRQYRRLHHGGGIDGFVTLISLLPKERVGFALFTNIQNGDIHGFVTEEIFGALLDDDWGRDGSKPSLPAGAEQEVGRYGVVGGLTVEVSLEQGVLVLTVPKQPRYSLIPMEGRKYRLGSPAPAGFYATFRPRSDEPERTELFLEQPQGDMIMSRLVEADYEKARQSAIPDELRELMGTYGLEGQEIEIEVGLNEGRVAVMTPGQSPAPIIPNGSDQFAFEGLPDGFRMTAIREGTKLVGLELVNPIRPQKLLLRTSSAPPKLSVSTILGRMRRAAGGRRLAKASRTKLVSTVDYVNQGLQARRTVIRRRPDEMHRREVLQAFDRDIATMTTRWVGDQAAQHTSFTQDMPLTNREINAIRLAALFDPLEPHPEEFGVPQVKRSGTVGEDPVVVLEVPVVTGGTITLYVSTRSWRVVKRTEVVPITKEGAEQVTTTVLEDYRIIGGIPVAHRMVTEGQLGKEIETVESFEIDGPEQEFPPMD